MMRIYAILITLALLLGLPGGYYFLDDQFGLQLEKKDKNTERAATTLEKARIDIENKNSKILSQNKDIAKKNAKLKICTAELKKLDKEYGKIESRLENAYMGISDNLASETLEGGSEGADLTNDKGGENGSSKNSTDNIKELAKNGTGDNFEKQIESKNGKNVKTETFDKKGSKSEKATNESGKGGSKGKDDGKNKKGESNEKNNNSKKELAQKTCPVQAEKVCPVCKKVAQKACPVVEKKICPASDVKPKEVIVYKNTKTTLFDERIEVDAMKYAYFKKMGSASKPFIGGPAKNIVEMFNGKDKQLSKIILRQCDNVFFKKGIYGKRKSDMVRFYRKAYCKNEKYANCPSEIKSKIDYLKSKEHISGSKTIKIMTIYNDDLSKIDQEMYAVYDDFGNRVCAWARVVSKTGEVRHQSLR